MLTSYNLHVDYLSIIPDQKALITTINAHCYNLTKSDGFYREVLIKSDVIIPDGIGVVWAVWWLTGKKIKKTAGADLFSYEMNRLQQIGGKCFFLGSSETILTKIKDRLGSEYPRINVQTYSPPYKSEFTDKENAAILKVVNDFQPDVLMIGMTAPKQEKWAYQHYNDLQVGHICCIGAVFDFYAGTKKRAPKWMIAIGLEWFYRLIKEPRRLWHRYLIGNQKFIFYVIKEKIALLRSK